MLQYVQYNILHDVLFSLAHEVSSWFCFILRADFASRERECCKVCSDHGVLSTTGSGSAQDQVAFSSHKDCSPNDRFFLKTSKAKTSVECKEDIQSNGWTEWTEAI